MPTIRELLDGKELSFAASPLAKHVSTHMQDPVGATKDQFGKLQDAKLKYDLAREETQRNLAPVQSVITHLSQMHGLQPDMPTPALGGGQPNSMGGVDPNDPNAPPPEELDENGQPIGKQQLGPDIPPNMDQTVGKMNMNRPTMVGHQPGVAPMMEKQVVPPKLGMASPGKPQARNSPAPNATQGNTYNRQAAPPKGNRSVPGAKGPGDAKVANRTKKAFGKSQGTKNELDQRRPIKVTVHASASPLRTVGIAESLGLASLKFRASVRAQASSMPIGPGGALGPSSVMPGNVPATGQPIKAGGPGSGRRPSEFGSVKQEKQHLMLRNAGFKYENSDSDGDHYYSHPTHQDMISYSKGGWNHGMQGDGSFSKLSGHLSALHRMYDVDARGVKALDELSDKVTNDPSHDVAYNPAGSGQGMKGKGHGTSHGAKKGWSTRGKGHLSAKEKSAHHGTLDFCAKCGGIHAREMECREFSTKQRKAAAKTGAAMPGGGYPIKNRSDLANAKQAIGRAKNRSATIAHINKRAQALGAPGFGQ